MSLIQVKDTKYALYKIAQIHRQKLNIPLIGVTGSVGKTTLTEMIYLALSKKFNATKTIDNYNNVVGLPYTILQVKREHEFGVYRNRS